MMKDYVEALEMCKRQAVQIVGLQRKLEIATNALKEIEKHTKELSLPSYTGMLCYKALKEIKEVK